jgi:hypothetical protein
MKVPALSRWLPMAEIVAEHHDYVARPKTGPQEYHAVQFADPRAVGQIALAAGHVLEMACIHD